MIFSKLCVLFLLPLVYAALNNVPSKHSDDHGDHKKVTEKSEHIDEMKIYQQLLKNKRMEQSSAVRNMIHLSDGDQQKKLVRELVSSIISVLTATRQIIEKAKFDPRSRKLPQDEKLKEKISEVLENTPFFMEFALYYPHFVTKTYKKPDVKELIDWAYRFSLDFGIYDESTLKMMNLAGQELRIIERSDDFFNPYDKINMRDALQAELVEQAKQAKMEKDKKKREYAKTQKRKNGPSLSRGEL
uniref:Coiled-coil domain-containing protein 134 n=1 Tax=Panagrolaimus sp. JU765 TaxID=591449 RepID=A0AC34QTY7_9BILA